METMQEATADQTKLWNGPLGRAWAERQELLDHMFAPFAEILTHTLAARPSAQVLDVGCGAGATTLAAARLLGAESQCVGIDVSKPLVVAAEARAAREQTPASFLCADAQRYPFEAGRFDLVISRFGVMFFDDPVEAFANLRRAARQRAELHFVAWRSALENPFMTTAERAAAPLLPNMPVRQADAPGQFGFASPQRVRDILAASGWDEIEIRPLDLSCTLPERELVRYLTQLGPLGLLLHDADPATRTRVIDVVRVAFEPYVRGAEVRFTAACWDVRARAPSTDAGSEHAARG